MWIIVGLGNPGRNYQNTRHNIGFRVIDALAEENNITLDEKNSYVIGSGNINGHKSILLKPMTFMNKSGIAAREALKRNNLLSDDRMKTLIVIHDDIDLDTGVIKLRRSGSSGGHRGVESIINEIGTKDFIRVKIGIGRDAEIPVENYVLTKFRHSEQKVIKEAITQASHAVSVILDQGIEKAMNKFNRSRKCEQSL
ncbi:MAG: aminoacyl-tRNA hydrolase [Nitrospirae bacterium]|nr:aminoacyl-tRNA hydrolase [Nitrospirota bacterium]